MANRLQYELKDYQAYDLTEVLLSGQVICFTNVITGQIGYSFILANGTSQLDALPFSEPVVVQTSGNVDLEDFRITGNRFKILNTGSSMIEVEIGTTLSSIKFYLQKNKEANFFFSGSVWVHEEENVITMSDSNLTLSDISGLTRVILPSSGITANRTVILPTLADNQNMRIKFDNRNSTYDLIIDGEGSETINGFTTSELEKEWAIIEGTSGDWRIVERSENYYNIPTANRNASWDLSSGSATTPTDIDFSAYIKQGRKATKVLIKAQQALSSGLISGEALFRKNGETSTNTTQAVRFYSYSNGFSNNTQFSRQFIVACDDVGIIEYWLTSATNHSLNVAIEGYWYE